MENTNIQPAGYAKLFAALSYFGFFWVLGLIIEPEKNDPLVKNHVNNGIILSLGFLAAGIVNIVPILGQLVSVVANITLLVFSIIGFIQALRGIYFTVPVVGEKFQFVR